MAGYHGPPEHLREKKNLNKLHRQQSTMPAHAPAPGVTQVALRLRRAVDSDHWSVVSQLLTGPGAQSALKALRSVAAETGENLAHRAAAVGSSRSLDALCNAGVDLALRNWRGQVPLHLAASAGSRDSVTVLLQHGADTSAEDKAGNSVLHLAASQGSPGAIETLLAAGAQADARNLERETPLHAAVRSGCLGSIRLLLEAGAAVNAEDCDGVTPLRLAARLCRDDRVAALLISHGGEFLADQASEE
jgi:ankyrin repeat protein